MNIVLDTNSLVSGMLWFGPPHEALKSSSKHIVSGDKHLLGLKSVFDVRILTATDFVKIHADS